MQNFALLLLCFALGMVLRKTGRLPEATLAALQAANRASPRPDAGESPTKGSSHGT